MWANNMEKKQIKTASVYSEQLMDPKASAGVNSAGKPLESKEHMFDGRGQLNAYSKRDAVEQQERFASLQSQHQRRPGKSASFYTPEQKQQIVEAAFLQNNADERLRFGAEMIPLILDRLDYEGFIRQVFRTHELAQGQINSYEKDLNVSALVIQEDGQTVETVVKGNRIFIPEFMVTSFPQVSISEIAQRQYDVVDRAHDKATFQIMLKEDKAGMRELYQSASLENNVVNFTGGINKTVLETLQYEVEKWRLIADKFIMNRQELGDLKKVVNTLEWDPITSRDLLLTGIFGQIWGVNLFISAGVDEQGLENVSVPPGMVFITTEPRYLGAMPIRVNLTVLPADQFVHGNPRYGWLFLEQIGMAVVNPRAVAVGMKAGTQVPQWIQN